MASQLRRGGSEMLLVDEWQAGGELIELGGNRIFVRASGAGEALLMIHGFPTSSLDWHALEARLRVHFRVISFDMLGFGLSDKPRDGDYRIAAQADLAEGVLSHFKVQRCRVLAHDYGNTVAQELLARQNERRCAWSLEQLCFLNGGLFPEAHRPRLIQRLLASPLGDWIARLTTYARFAANMRQICKLPLADDDLRAQWALIQRQHGVRVMPLLIGYMAERRQFRARWVGALLTAKAPLRLIDGLADPISGANMVQRYRELVPQPDVVELAHVGHYPQLESPDAVAAAFLDFVGALR